MNSEINNTKKNIQYNLYAEQVRGYRSLLGSSGYGVMDFSTIPEIENVIFNNLATVVFWVDGTKTVVKAYDEVFDPEKGLAMAISKKALGNKGNYFNRIKKWVKAESIKHGEYI